MFLKSNKIRETIARELRCMTRMKGTLIAGMVIGAIIIIASWLCFEGPCRLSLFFKVPGGGITIGAYYVLWFLMFTLSGAEGIIIFSVNRRCSDNRIFLGFISSVLCMFLWYPLFFTTFSQFFSLIVIIAAVVLIIIEAFEIEKYSATVFFYCIIKIVILLIFTYINLAFLILN